MTNNPSQQRRSPAYVWLAGKLRDEERPHILRAYAQAAAAGLTDEQIEDIFRGEMQTDGALPPGDETEDNRGHTD
jgi:hypothetical protein